MRWLARFAMEAASRDRGVCLVESKTRQSLNTKLCLVSGRGRQPVGQELSHRIIGGRRAGRGDGTHTSPSFQMLSARLLAARSSRSMFRQPGLDLRPEDSLGCLKENRADIFGR